MLDEEMRYFLEYCRISDFSEKSIESLNTRLNEFNEFLKTTTVTSLIDISYQHLRRFVADYKSPSVYNAETKASVGEARRAHPKGFARLPNTYPPKRYQVLKLDIFDEYFNILTSNPYDL